MSRIIIRPAAPRPRFKVGSRAFFDGMPGFMPGDLDEVEFEDEPDIYQNVLQFHKRDGTRCLYRWRRMTPGEFIDYTLRSRLPMELGKFLVPAVAEFLGFTIEDLARLRPVAERLDPRHAYERIIFESYMHNGGFFLTEEQRALAFEAYRRARM